MDCPDERLGREEELEDTVSHLSIYLTGLDRLYREQAKQLKHQIRRAEKAEQELEIQWRRTIEAEAQAYRGTQKRNWITGRRT
jgi:hypothetical protein